MLFALTLCAVVGHVGIVDDRLANSWIDSYLKTDEDTHVARSTSDWATEFTNLHREQHPNQMMPVEHFWARDFLGRHEHDVWWVWLTTEDIYVIRFRNVLCPFLLHFTHRCKWVVVNIVVHLLCRLDDSEKSDSLNEHITEENNRSPSIVSEASAILVLLSILLNCFFHAYHILCCVISLDFHIFSKGFLWEVFRHVCSETFTCWMSSMMPIVFNCFSRVKRVDVQFILHCLQRTIVLSLGALDYWDVSILLNASLPNIFWAGSMQ